MSTILLATILKPEPRLGVARSSDTSCPDAIPPLRPLPSRTTAGARVRGFLVLHHLLLAAVLVSYWGQATEAKYPLLQIGEKILTNATPISATATHVVFRCQGGFERVALDDLSSEMRAGCLKALEQNARERQEEKSRHRAIETSNSTDRRAELVGQEQALGQRIRMLERQLDDLQDQLAMANRSAKGKPNSAARRKADYLRGVKGDLMLQINNARNVRDGIRRILNASP